MTRPRREEKSVHQSKVRNRRRQQSLDGLNQKLSVPKIPGLSGYHLAWVNDQDGRPYYKNTLDDYDYVTNAELGGVPIGDKVTEDDRQPGAKVSKRVGTTENGAPILAYLMKKRLEFFKDDQAEKQAKISENEQQLKKGGDHLKSHQHGDVEITRGT